MRQKLPELKTNIQNETIPSIATDNSDREAKVEMGAPLAHVYSRLLILAVCFQEFLEAPVLHTGVVREHHAATRLLTQLQPHSSLMHRSANCNCLWMCVCRASS